MQYQRAETRKYALSLNKVANHFQNYFEIHANLDARKTASIPLAHNATMHRYNSLSILINTPIGQPNDEYSKIQTITG